MHKAFQTFETVSYCFSTPLLETGGKAWLSPRRLRPAQRFSLRTPPRWAAFMTLIYQFLLENHVLLGQAVYKIQK